MFGKIFSGRQYNVDHYFDVVLNKNVGEFPAGTKFIECFIDFESGEIQFSNKNGLFFI